MVKGDMLRTRKDFAVIVKPNMALSLFEIVPWNYGRMIGTTLGKGTHKRLAGSNNKTMVLKVEFSVILFPHFVLFIPFLEIIALHGAGGAMFLGYT